MAPSTHLACFATLALGLAAWSTPARAILISGTYPGNDGSQSNVVTGRVKAFKFALPAGEDYMLSNVILRLKAYEGNEADVGIYSDDAGGTNPGSLLLSLDAPATQGSGIFDYTFTPGSQLMLSASTTYWMSVRGVSGGFDWLASSPSVDPTGLATTFIPPRLSFNGGSTYAASSIINTFQINATEVPGPLPVLGAVAALRTSRRIRHRIRAAKADNPVRP